MQICEENLCTGCAACVNICNNNAISMITDTKGFLRPIIDNNKCISCGLCAKKCPQNNEIVLNTQSNIYASMAKNDKIREDSSSGGIFSLLAEEILKEGGVVFGAELKPDMRVCHTCVDNINDLYKLRGSKYLQSDIGLVFRDVKKYLFSGKTVMFSGTPCQIDGLYKYLGNKPENLITIDLLCHGVPSCEMFRKYINYVETKYNKKVVNVNFRKKTPGWKNFHFVLDFEDGSNVIDVEHTYCNGFLKDLFLRNCCYNCKYRNENRIGDITLGDYWGYKETAPRHIEDDDRGISFVSVNNKIGEKLYKKVKRKMIFTKRSIEDAKKGNPVLCYQYKTKKPMSYNDFWSDYPKLSWSELSDKYFPRVTEFKDYMCAEDRKYYSIPYRRRHIRHLIHCWKCSVLMRLRKGK